MNWISVNDRLPPENHYVLVHVLRDNWKGPKEDPFGCHYVVAAIHYGLSKADRQRMRDGSMEEPKEPCEDGFGTVSWVRRSKVFAPWDEDGNNERPYSWSTFGPSRFFGQEVDFWCEIDRLPVLTTAA